MNLVGTVTSKTTGIFVNIPVLKAEYGPLSYLGDAGDYAVGSKVMVSRVGADEYVVVGVLHP